jgi:hypothetical protein
MWACIRAYRDYGWDYRFRPPRGRWKGALVRPVRRPYLGRRVVRGLEALLRAQDGNLLAIAERRTAPARRDYERGVRYLERLVDWARGGRR